MIDVRVAVKSAKELDQAVETVAKLVWKLQAKPDLAEKLGQALAEVGKTLHVVGNAASEYLSLGIDEGALAKNSKLLLAIEDESLTTEVERGRGHCRIIHLIYEQYLDKWFESAFDPDEYASVKKVFDDLGSADHDLLKNLETMAVALENEAGVVIDLVVRGKEAKARIRVLSALPALRPLRKTISKTMQTLYSIQGDLVDMTHVVQRDIPGCHDGVPHFNLISRDLAREFQ